MGNSCAIDREEFTKQDIFDFRFKGENKQKPLSAVQPKSATEKNTTEETAIPEYKEHLKNVEKDPYEDKYA